MSKFITYIKSSLRRQILMGSLFSLVIGIGIFAACYASAAFVLDHSLYSEAHAEAIHSQVRGELEEYIDTHYITMETADGLDRFVPSVHGQVFFRLYDGNLLIYTYFGEKHTDLERGLGYIHPTEGVEVTPQKIVLADQMPVDLVLGYTSNFRAGTVMLYLSLLAGVIGFAVCLYHLLRGKIRYIETLRSELDILSSGQLSYDVTVSGTDELGVLAGGINEMKDTIIRRQEAEDAARKANNDLIKAMAHDLRSPLTSLIGYLEILKNKKYESEEQSERFMAQSLKKAFQIKDMSDKLFEYFLVYSADRDEQDMEAMPANDLLWEILNDFVWSLENKGFRAETNDIRFSGLLKANPELLKRLFDNLYSNLIKYADTDHAVTIFAEENENAVRIRVINQVRKDAAVKEGSHIGLATCERIATFHEGSFSVNKTEDEFWTELLIPVCTHR